VGSVFVSGFLWKSHAILSLKDFVISNNGIQTQFVSSLDRQKSVSREDEANLAQAQF
jgi:hypothetical protein